MQGEYQTRGCCITYTYTNSRRQAPLQSFKIPRDDLSLSIVQSEKADEDKENRHKILVTYSFLNENLEHPPIYLSFHLIEVVVVAEQIPAERRLGYP